MVAERTLQGIWAKTGKPNLHIMNTSRLVSMLLCLSSAASAVVLTLGPSTQTVTFTGTAVNASAAGTSRISWGDRKSTRLNSSHLGISYAVFWLKTKKSIRGRRALRLVVWGRLFAYRGWIR